MTRALVLMTTYNGAKYVNQQIDSILAQTGVDITLYILDDKSSDNTFERLQEIAANNNNIQVFQNELNAGVPAINFFALMEKVTNPDLFEFYAFADQDDCWLPQKLEQSIKKCVENQADLYASGLRLWDGEKEFGFQAKDKPQKQFDYLFQSASAGCTYTMNAKLFTLISNIIRGVDFKSWKYFSHDWFVYFIARHHQCKVFIDRESYILYRIHANNNFGLVDITKPSSIFKRLSFLNDHWYRNHLEKMLPFMSPISTDYTIVDTIISKYFFARIKLLLSHGSQLRREFSYNSILNLLILFNRI